jgi:hypothetical protein
MEQEYQHIEFDQLTAEEQAQARKCFSDDQRHPMTAYTYSRLAGGQLSSWRYWKPSEACLAMIEMVMTRK